MSPKKVELKESEYQEVYTIFEMGGIYRVTPTRTRIL